ncbi:MAG: oxidoreductase, partial [Planktomarina sp.]
DEGRGGSLFMHQKVNVGDAMTIGYPVNLFSLDLRANKHLFVAGGIGITPFMAQIKQLDRAGGNWELHYSCRSQ